MEEKKCTKCKARLPLTEFYKELDEACSVCKKRELKDKYRSLNKKRYRKEYYQAHKKELAVLERARRANPKTKLSYRISAYIRKSLNGGKKGKHWEDIVGYDVTQLKEHLEGLFTEGMSWDNYGEWHIDHKRPIASFYFESPTDQDFKECWALENLQPLWAIDNFKKGAMLLAPSTVETRQGFVTLLPLGCAYFFMVM